MELSAGSQSSTAVCLAPVCTCSSRISSQRPAHTSHPGRLLCCQRQLSDVPEPARSRTQVTHDPAATTLVRGTLWLQQSWVTHTQRVWQGTKSRQPVWKRMLSANVPGLGLHWHLDHTSSVEMNYRRETAGSEQVPVSQEMPFLSHIRSPRFSCLHALCFSTFPQRKRCRTRSSRASKQQTRLLARVNRVSNSAGTGPSTPKPPRSKDLGLQRYTAE